jgi:uncharacterized repeat protein (TIGR01451 family)
MKRKSALIGSMCIALLVVSTVLAVTTASSVRAVTINTIKSVAAPLAAGGIKISQAYGGGGNSGSLYKRDFVELFNSSSSAVDVTGWSVQYTSVAGSTWQTTTLAGTIAPGQYFLVAEAAGAGGTLDLPTPDITGTIPMGATGFKVALANSTTTLSGACPITSSAVVDFVGTGTANCSEGSSPAPAPSNTASDLRKLGGCQDTDINATDFITVTPPTPRNSSSPTSLCTFAADLSVRKTGPVAVSAGDSISYTIYLSNTGNITATTTILTDTFPVEVSFVTYTTASPVTFTQSPTELVWELGDVAATTATLSIQVQGVVSPSIANGTRFTNTVTASTAYTETSLGNNTAQVATLVGSPDLVVVKDGPVNVNAGDTLSFTLTYSNAGDLPATGVMLVDQLPTAMSYVTDSVPATVAASGVITWSMGSLNPDQSGSIVLTATALYAGQYQNRVTINGVPLDSDLSNNISIVTTTIAGANPYVHKSGPAILIGGDVVSYTITYGNHGSLPTGVITLTDNLPAEFSVSNIVGDNSGLNLVSSSGSIRVWTTTVAAGSSSVFTLALTVPNSATIASGTLVTNTVQVTSLDLGNDPSDDVATATGTVYQIVPIATARAGSNGQVFAVEGNVTVIPATYSAGEWELQDASGGITAFYTPAPTLALGDRVRLVGVFDNSYGTQPELASPRYFAKLGSGSPVNPILHHTGDVPAGATPGWLVTISGTLSGLSTCSGNYHLSVNDGSGAADVFINLYSNPAINPCGRGFTNGDWIQVMGFSTIYSPTYEVRPRMASDLVQYPRVLKVGPTAGATNVALSANITATFNTTMTNVDTSTFLVQGPSGSVAGAVLYDASSKTATFTPAVALASNTRYTATLKSTLMADNGLTLMPSQDYVWTFTTHTQLPNLSTSTKTNAINGAVRSGDLVMYTISLINTGDANATAIITDVVSTYYTVATPTGFTQPTTGTLIWTGVVTAGQMVNLQFVARVKPVGQLPIGTALLFNSVLVNDGLHPVFTLVDPTPPLITIYGTYLPLIRR